MSISSAPNPDTHTGNIDKPDNPFSDVLDTPIFCNDPSLYERGFEMLPRKLLERYKLIGMTWRHLRYMVAVNSFQITPGLPYPGADAIAAKMHCSPHTVYAIQKEMKHAGNLEIIITTLPGAQGSIGGTVYCKDFTKAYRKINALDDPTLMQQARQLDALRTTTRSELAQRSAMRRRKDQGNKDDTSTATMQFIQALNALFANVVDVVGDANTECNEGEVSNEGNVCKEQQTYNNSTVSAKTLLQSIAQTPKNRNNDVSSLEDDSSRFSNPTQRNDSLDSRSLAPSAEHSTDAQGEQHTHSSQSSQCVQCSQSVDADSQSTTIAINDNDYPHHTITKSDDSTTDTHKTYQTPQMQRKDRGELREPPFRAMGGTANCDRNSKSNSGFTSIGDALSGALNAAQAA